MLGQIQAEEPGVQPEQGSMYGESSRAETLKARRKDMREEGRKLLVSTDQEELLLGSGESSISLSKLLSQYELSRFYFIAPTAPD